MLGKTGFVVFVALLAYSAAAPSRLEQLRTAIVHYDDATLPELSSGNYSKFASEGPREYSLAILFVTRDAKYQCQSCPYVEKELLILARSYAAATPPEERKWFFVAVNYDKAPEAFQMNGLQSVPVLLKRSTGRSGVRPGRPDANSMLEMPLRLEDDDAPLPDAHGFAQFLHMNTEFTIKRDPSEMLTPAIIVTLVFASLAAITFHVPDFLYFPVSKHFWMFVSLAVYGVSVSGMIYCVIRTPGTHNMDRNNEVVLFQRGQGQLVYEGLTVGAMNLLAAAGIILTHRTLTSKTQSNTRLVAFTLVGLCLFAVVYLRIIELYSLKTGWYRVESTIPRTQWSDITKGSNNLWRWAKRSWRLLNLGSLLSSS